MTNLTILLYRVSSMSYYKQQLQKQWLLFSNESPSLFDQIHALIYLCVKLVSAKCCVSCFMNWLDHWPNSNPCSVNYNKKVFKISWIGISFLWSPSITLDMSLLLKIGDITTVVITNYKLFSYCLYSWPQGPPAWGGGGGAGHCAQSPATQLWHRLSCDHHQLHQRGPWQPWAEALRQPHWHGQGWVSSGHALRLWETCLAM